MDFSDLAKFYLITYYVSCQNWKSVPNAKRGDIGTQTNIGTLTSMVNYPISKTATAITEVMGHYTTVSNTHKTLVSHTLPSVHTFYVRNKNNKDT